MCVCVYLQYIYIVYIRCVCVYTHSLEYIYIYSIGVYLSISRSS